MCTLLIGIVGVCTHKVYDVLTMKLHNHASCNHATHMQSHLTVCSYTRATVPEWHTSFRKTFNRQLLVDYLTCLSICVFHLCFPNRRSHEKPNVIFTKCRAEPFNNHSCRINYTGLLFFTFSMASPKRTLCIQCRMKSCSCRITVVSLLIE